MPGSECPSVYFTGDHAVDSDQSEAQQSYHTLPSRPLFESLLVPTDYKVDVFQLNTSITTARPSLGHTIQ